MRSDLVLVGVAAFLVGGAVGVWLGVVWFSRRTARTTSRTVPGHLARLGERLSDTQLHIRLNLGGAAVWLLLLPPTVFLWRESVAYVVFMSWYANFVGHISAYVAAKAEESIENGTAEMP